MLYYICWKLYIWRPFKAFISFAKYCFIVINSHFCFPDHDAAINRYSRLSKKRENDKVWNILNSFSNAVNNYFIRWSSFSCLKTVASIYFVCFAVLPLVYFFKFYLLILEREEGGGKRQRERERICCSTYLCIHWLFLVCALSRDGTLHFGVSGWRSNQLSYLAGAALSLVFFPNYFKAFLIIVSYQIISDWLFKQNTFLLTKFYE